MEGKFDRHRGAKIWKVVLLCVMWAIWCEHDNKAFEGSILSPNNTVLRCLFEWKTNLGCIPSCHFLDFIETLNLSL